MTMDEFLLKFMKEKFKLTKIVKSNCEKTILSLLKYAGDDIRIDMLRRFIGIGDSKIQREILDCFLIILKNLPISFYKIYDETDTPYIMGFDTAFDILNHKFPHYLLSAEAFDKLIRVCEIYDGDKKLEESRYEKVRDIYFLHHFYNKNTTYIENLLQDYKSKKKLEEDILEMSHEFISANRDYDIKLNTIFEVFENNFKILKKTSTIDLDSFFAYFLKKLYFKIRIVDYLKISLEIFIQTYNGLQKLLLKMWEKADIKKQGIIFYKEFEQVLGSLLGSSENKWKIIEYFK